MKPARGYEALRRHRYSSPGSSYFVTCCTQGRRKGLNTGAIAQAIAAEITACEMASHSRLHGLVIMPDHVHLLLQLGSTLTLGQLVALDIALPLPN
jgi:putative transposase